MEYSTSLIMWTWQDDQVEHPDRLDGALADIAAAGFSGALAMLRGCRYPISDPLVLEAARHAAGTAHRLGLAFWFALDPRLDQGRLIAMPGGRAACVLTNRASDGTLPCEAGVDGSGRYRIRLDYEPRSQHMLSQVAISVEPEAVELAALYRKAADGTVIASSIRDVTPGARLFVQRAAGYLEIFGRVEPPPGDGWHVLALPRCTSAYPDLGSDDVVDAVCALYREYHRAGVVLDGVFWDEIGFVTGYGEDRSRLPWSPSVAAALAGRQGGDTRTALLHLLLDDDEGTAARVRRNYYAAVQDVVLDAQERCSVVAQALWGDQTDSGIHQTWHQNADDLPHGTGDWWRGSTALSGGFTDVGDAEQRTAQDEMLTMIATAAALARHHERPRAFCNLWGVNYGDDLVDHWSHLLCAFGVTWLMHTYGPTGYVDHATVWGPGHPDHPTWPRMAELNHRIARLRGITGGGLPTADLAVVYPVGTLARVGDASANALARDTHGVVAGLVRHGLAPDVISPDLFAGSDMVDGRLAITTPHGRLYYDAVVYPHPQTLQPAELERLEELGRNSVPTVLVGRPPRETTEGGTAPTHRVVPLNRLDSAVPGLPRLVDSPTGCVANVFDRRDGTRAVVVTPVRPGVSVTGPVRAAGAEIAVAGLRGIAAARFDDAGRLLDSWAYDGEVVR